jgi:hypothetical protein
MQLAARMDEAVDEQGHTARLDPDRGVIVDGEIVPNETPTAQQLISPSKHGSAEEAASSQAQNPDGAADVSDKKSRAAQD